MGDIDELYGRAFDTHSVEPSTTFDALKAGWYPVLVTGGEIKDTKAGTGKYLHLELTILENPNGGTGRKVFPNITLINPNEKAMEIGQRDLAAVGQACGLAALQDTGELIDKTLQVRLKVVDSEQYGKDNDVSAYKALDGAPAAAPAGVTYPMAAALVAQAPVAQAPVARAPAPAKRPWEK